MKDKAKPRCPLCKNGSLTSGVATETFEQGSAVIVVRNIPADVCNNCGEEFISDAVSRKLVEDVNKEFDKGVQIEVLNFAA